jgi:hypothetical protein
MPTSATADTPRCVTLDEFIKVQSGWTRLHVWKVFDVPGWRVAQYSRGKFTYQQRDYRGCSEGVTVTVLYRHPRGSTKPYRVIAKGLT